MPLKISIANSRLAKTWVNKEITWEKLVEKLSTTQKTVESLEEFLNMKKADQDVIKDVGGYVMGHLKQGLRRVGHVLCRSCLTLDMDYATPGIIQHVRTKVQCKGLAYGTHKYSPDNPRLRIIFPLSREISEEEYEPVARMTAQKIGMDYFDDSTYEANRMMFWPSTPSNIEYYFEAWDGSELNPDEILAEYDDWKDISTWPTSSKQSIVIKRNAMRQADPLTKKGIVGVFCRTYSVSDAISKFLSDVYTESEKPGRYDYIPGTGFAGVQIFEDKFAYSHHATDPAYGKLLNSFDLVRTHKFPDDDSRESFNSMSRFALDQPEIKMVLARERQEAAGIEFNDDEWQNHLRYAKGNNLENSVWNLLLILRNDGAYANFGYNEMAHMVEITGGVPWYRPIGTNFWLDSDSNALKADLDIRYASFSTRNHDVAFSKITMERKFNPIKDYLDNLPAWDGVERVPNLLIKYMNAENTEYVRTVTRKTFAAAVARIYRPGIKFDSLLVLDGEQGIGKSSLFRELVGEEYFSDSLQLNEIDGKTAAEKIQGSWIIEIAELAGMKKAEIEKVKAFLSSSDDKYRPSYGKFVESHPRSCILVATVNGQDGYLRDITGNRRFWIVKLSQTEQKKSYDISQSEKDQIWAEAKYYYENGEKLYIDNDELLKVAAEVQKDAMETDDRLGMVEMYLEKRLPENWENMDLYDRRAYLSEYGSAEFPKGSSQRQTVSNIEIWCECFGKNPSDMQKKDSYTIAGIMAKIKGWEREQTLARIPLYGRQRIYTRKS